MVKVLMRHGTCMCGLFGIHLNLKRLVMFMDIVSLALMLDLIVPLFSVTGVILLTAILIHVLIMHVMHNLSLHHSRTILMLS